MISLWLPLILSIVLLFLGIEIIVILGIAALLFTYIDMGFSFGNVGITVFESLNAEPFLALPLYVLTGDLILRSGMADQLVRFSRSIVGTLPGGTALTAVVASGFFAAISGSNAATVGAIGQTMKEPMRKEGYPPEFAMATVASAGTVGIIIPPSIVFIIYGIATGVSVSDLFMGGIIPGVLMLVSMCLVIMIKSKKNNWDTKIAFSIKELMLSMWGTKWAIMAIMLILGGIYSGVFTPTEAAAVAVIYCFLVGFFITKKLKLRDIPDLCRNSAKITGLIAPIVTMSVILAQALTFLGVPEAFVDLMLSYADSPITILLAMMAIILITGCFIESTPALLILTPLFIPLTYEIGMDSVHFGVMMVVGLTIGFITPPMGLNLFVASSISGVSIQRIITQIWWFVVFLIVVWLLVAFVPGLSLWLV